MIKTNPGKYTIHNLIKLYNKTFPEKPCGKSDNALAKSLLDVYGEEVDMLLATGYHSSEEYKFFIILNNYFSKYKIKLGKRFVLDNTYVYYGLPPTPICNPGKKAIEAAANPDISDYLYFVATGSGGHNFASSLQQHNHNVSNYRKNKK